MPPPYRLVDLTHPLHPGIPTWEGNCGFENRSETTDLPSSPGVHFRIQRLLLTAGVGTHLDAPAHLSLSNRFVADLLLEDLSAPCRVLDVSDRAEERFLLGREEVLRIENAQGPVEPGDVVLVRTGWDRHWERPDRYRNGLVFPSVSREAAELLLERGVVGLGIDTLSPDRMDSGFPVHRLFLGAGKYLLENVANLERMPQRGGHLLALPIPIVGGTEAPVRLVGLL